VADLEFDILLPKGKKEKVSRKRKDLLVVRVSESPIPEPGLSSTASRNEVNITQKEQRHITWSDMPPPAAKLKKPRTQNSSSTSSSSTPSLLEDKVSENPFPLEPMGTARPPRDQASDRGRSKPMGPSLTGTGSGSGSSSNLLNTSVSVSADIVPNFYCNSLASHLFQFLTNFHPTTVSCFLLFRRLFHPFFQRLAA
jgi:hypothetical protein